MSIAIGALIHAKATLEGIVSLCEPGQLVLGVDHGSLNCVLLCNLLAILHIA